MKQRLVGTIVLGSLALIIIPLLLDGEGMEPPPMASSIPPAPIIDVVPLPEPLRPEILADNLEPDIQSTPLPTTDPAVGLDAEPPTVQQPPEATVAETNSTPAPVVVEAVPEAEERTVEEEPQIAVAPADETSPQLDPQGLPEAWSVRLGSFGDRANADALVARLLAANYKAYLRPIQSGQNSFNGVFVGPVLTRREANALQAKLAMEFQLNGIVLQFEIAP